MTNDLHRTRIEFFRDPAICLGVVLLVHLWPKGREIDDLLRLALTLAWFGAVLYGLYHVYVYRAPYLLKLYKWRYEDGGPALERTWQRYLFSVTRAVNPLLLLLMAFVTANALDLLQQWRPLGFLEILKPLYGPLWWISIAGLLLYPVAGSYLIGEAVQRGRMLREEVETSEFEPRALADLGQLESESRRPAVEAIAPFDFRAGGAEWFWEDFYKNAIVFGQSGTGKTVCVLNAILEGLLSSAVEADKRVGGLILDPKGDFRGKIRHLCRRYGREEDLLVLAPGAPDETIRWNPLDSDDDQLELAGRFAAVLESTGMKAGQDSFWIDSSRKFLRHAITLIRGSNEDLEHPSFADVCELAHSADRISERAERLDPEDPAFDRCLEYFAGEWSELPSETRSSIQAYLTNMIDPFLMEPYQTVLSGNSTMRIGDMIDDGKILYVYMPIADKESMSRVVCTFVKLEYYREILKRPNKDRPSFFLCDEFQSFFTLTPGKGDADFFERSRQSNHANIIATQNLPALSKVSPQKAPVMNLLGNCAVKMFLRNSDSETNQYGSQLFGERIVGMASTSASGGNRRLGGLFGGGNGGTQSANMQYDAAVRTEAFAELAVPSRPDGIDFCESIVYLASRGEVRRRKLRWKVHPLVGV